MDSVSHCSYRVRDPTEGLWHITNILSVLVDISTEAVISYDATSAFQDYLAWMLDSILSVHELHKRRRETPQLPQFNNQLEELLFCTVHALIGSLKGFMSQIILHKSYVLLAILCADILAQPTELSGDSIRVTLCSSLIILSIVCRDEDYMCRLVSLQVTTAITIALENESICSVLGDDFKVCCPTFCPFIRLFLTILQKAAVSFCEACQIEIPDMIVGNVSDSFQSDILNAEFCRLDLRTEQILEAVEAKGPPSKRRKLSKAARPLDELVSNLYSVLGHQKVTDLYGLRQVTE